MDVGNGDGKAARGRGRRGGRGVYMEGDKEGKETRCKEGKVWRLNEKKKKKRKLIFLVC